MTQHDLTIYISAELGWIAAILDMRAARDAIDDPDIRRDASSIIAAWLEHRVGLLRN